MVEPNTVNRGLIVPNTGDLVGAWGTAALNPDFVAIDGCFGGVVTVSLTNTNVSLSVATGSITPSAGPTQSDNAVIKFTGTLTGNCVITFPCPGFYIVENNCTLGAFNVQVRAAGTGSVLGLPPGEPCHIYNDGTDFKFVNMGRVGSYIKMGVSTTPAWMSACTVLPYLICVGATHTIATFPALFAVIGTAFGGNGINTFAVPDLGGRVDAMRDFLGTRLTSGVSGVDGSTVGAVGGTQLAQTHSHGVTDPGHNHVISPVSPGVLGPGSGQAFTSGGAAQATFTIAAATTNISLQAALSGNSQNVQPTIISGVTFIKT